MKRNSSLISLGLVFILWFGLATKCSSIKSSNGNSNGGGNVNASSSNRFVGTWKPTADDKRGALVDSFVINDDGTFVIKSTDSKNEEIRGTYTKTGDKLKLVAPRFTSRHNSPEVTITDDGRLKMLENAEDRRPMYFVRK